MIDLRSDTVTKPSQEMREEMKQAKVGDDVYGEDPTINKLERMVAECFDREAALYVPSGTMGNQTAVNVHTNPSDEVILDSDSHIYNFELATMSSFSGVMPRPIETEKKYLPIEKVRNAIRPEKYYLSRTGLIALENTLNRKGGVIYPRGKMKKLTNFAKDKEIPIHLDGARIFNATVAKDTSVEKLTEGIDSIMFCLSKGLGAPVGSTLVGSGKFIEKARRVRKRMGGGMRQAGILAAAGIYALENNVKRLENDHENAKLLADSLSELDGIRVKPPETNILILETINQGLQAEELVEKAEENDVLIGTIGPNMVRIVTHLGVDRKDVEEAAARIKKVLRNI
ncbi:threonine aldolase [candidate division MSBL1 archaeon SCGC-AAA382C18]|uniref:Threonine aldolase n=1 Tax=candidate division MSBL1 archaeon SCGC-AAA382C18 TaxID=1698281 RepID=A0A133VK72_9EURY|nr:threonine aldolase [candidate division MSBL1 archaeon SCGC-AAA382C18]